MPPDFTEVTEAMAQSATKKNRPKYLSLPALLFQIRLPLPGWVSILHRASGALLFLATVWLLYLLDRSLASEQGFEHVKRYAALPLVKVSLLVLVWAYCHHFCAGIRFLFLDLDRGVDKAVARATSVAVLVASLALTAFFGAKLW
jgi:succinate dehydrogenase / fumarate reductase cytochrome b subunit